MSPHAFIAAVISGLTSMHSVVSAQEGAQRTPTLDCKVGPLTKTYGQSPWLVYSCNDRLSLVFVSAPGSPAFPFVFTLAATDGKYRLSGTGTGSKVFTGAAFEELKILTKLDIRALIEQTKAVTAR
jgi:hypothetical protein